MMKHKTLIIVCLFLIACSGGGGSSVSLYNDKITAWQAMEQLAPDIQTSCEYTGDIIPDIVCVVNSISPWNFSITPPDEPDYWQTSEESFKLMSGDCEDISALVYRVLHDSFLPQMYDVDIRIRILDDGSKTDHTVVIICYDNGVFEINNFHFLQTETDLPVIAEYDLFFIFVI